MPWPDWSCWSKHFSGSCWNIQAMTGLQSCCHWGWRQDAWYHCCAWRAAARCCSCRSFHHWLANRCVSQSTDYILFKHAPITKLNVTFDFLRFVKMQLFSEAHLLPAFLHMRSLWQLLHPHLPVCLALWSQLAVWSSQPLESLCALPVELFHQSQPCIAKSANWTPCKWPCGKPICSSPATQIVWGWGTCRWREENSLGHQLFPKIAFCADVDCPSKVILPPPALIHRTRKSSLHKAFHKPLRMRWGLDEVYRLRIQAEHQDHSAWLELTVTAIFVWFCLQTMHEASSKTADSLNATLCNCIPMFVGRWSACLSPRTHLQSGLNHQPLKLEDGGFVITPQHDIVVAKGLAESNHLLGGQIKLSLAVHRHAPQIPCPANQNRRNQRTRILAWFAHLCVEVVEWDCGAGSFPNLFFKMFDKEPWGVRPDQAILELRAEREEQLVFRAFHPQRRS